ncbi:PTS fructose transporter subunit IIA [Algiphilus sp.]|uniref:PTS sugar transporter subunit IIA n=1 Tax=Algiphilus sp. TaxID=1872431 RepID=UPI0025C0E3A2|nr:PTS fructose transporter subunit IIA [Algiphilus sp.]MCK5769416.1 PTS fructose transporter subunit IIA [Algiphilus sp.]
MSSRDAPVGVLLVTHGRLGRFFLDTLRDMLGELSLPVEVLEVRRVLDTELLTRDGQRMIERLDAGRGVLVLTDAFGSTPSNIASRLLARGRTRVLAGLNLPMLVRVFNYPALDLDALAEAAVEGGRRGIIFCPEEAGSA